MRKNSLLKRTEIRAAKDALFIGADPRDRKCPKCNRLGTYLPETKEFKHATKLKRPSKTVHGAFTWINETKYCKT